VSVEVTTLPGVDLDPRNPRGANPLDVVARLLVSLDDGDRHSLAQGARGSHQHGSLSRARARDQIHGEDPVRLEAAPIGRSVCVVARQQILLDRDPARFGRVGMRVMVVVRMRMGSIAVVVMMVARSGRRLDVTFLGTTTASRAHHATSSSLIRT
jgi:hypothetical protein